MPCLDHDIDMRGLHDDRCGIFHGETAGVGHGKEAWRALGLSRIDKMSSSSSGSNFRNRLEPSSI